MRFELNEQRAANVFSVTEINEEVDEIHTVQPAHHVIDTWPALSVIHSLILHSVYTVLTYRGHNQLFLFERVSVSSFEDLVTLKYNVGKTRGIMVP